MTDNDRIEQLEAKVRVLQDELRKLKAADALVEAGPGAESDSAHGGRRERASHTPGSARDQYNADVSRNIDTVLGGEPGEPLESRIGAIWLSRVGVLLLATALILGGRLTIEAELLAAGHKIAIGYGTALAAVAYGLVFRKERDLFSQAVLGAGLAIFYFTTYAMFFVGGMRLFETPRIGLALPILLACLVVSACVAHWRKSQTAAGVWLFLAYYTVVLSCIQELSVDTVLYALGTCTVLAVVALVFHSLHRWLLFTWIAMLATYASYIYFFLQKPAGLDMSDKGYFWVSNGFMALCWLVFSIAAVMDARKTGEYRRTVAPMAGVNSFIFFCLSWLAIREHYIEYEWLFRLGFTGLLLGFTIFAETTGPRRNYLFQVFVAKTVIMFTLALQAYLSGEKLLVAIALECLALGFSYKRSGVVTFKVLELGLLLVTFVGCLGFVKVAEPLTIGPYTVGANWFCCVGASAVLVTTACFFEHFVSRPRPDQRVVSGQWFMADTFVDLPSATVSMLHAAAAALILLTITIMEYGDHPALPYLLGGEGIAMALTGFALRTAQVEAAAVLLILAAHVCYHAFRAFGLVDIAGQETYTAYTVLLALFTFVGAHFWERYLRRLKGGKPWEHDFLTAIPYLGAAFMLTTLMDSTLEPLYAAVGQSALGAVLLLVGCMSRYPAVKASGIMAFAVATGTFYSGLYAVASPIHRHEHFLAGASALLVCFVIGERCLSIERRHHLGPPPTEPVLRTLLVGAGTFMAIMGLYEWCDTGGLTLYWLGLASITITIGGIFRESRYRWAALVVLAMAVARAFLIDLRRLSLLEQFLSFAGLGLVLLATSWVYSYRRRKALDKNDSRNAQDSTPDG